MRPSPATLRPAPQLPARLLGLLLLTLLPPPIPAASPRPLPQQPAAGADADDPLESLLGPVNRIDSLGDPEQLLGHGFGERISTHGETLAFCRELAARSDRVQLIEHGQSVEGRTLFHLLISRPETLAEQERVRAGLQILADPRGHDSEDIDSLVEGLPAVAWLAYSVHGDEISCTDAAMLLAWHLASAEGDELVDLILDSTITGIDPLQNPDGRDRFVFGARQTRGMTPDASKSAAERDQPWPGGRVNHHLFDMNRDWFALTQPETRARVKLYQHWWPQVFVDLHEMGAESSYYFAPPAEPLNPEITESQRDWLDRYGRGNAEWFDRLGYDYFVRDVFDSFYPGYGEGWPTFHGSVGMTFEQASPRGLVVELDHGEVLRYRDAVDHHFAASLGTCETTARNRRQALRRFVDDRSAAVQKGRTGPVREFILPLGRDPGRTRRLAENLAFQGIEVRRAERDFTNERAREHGERRAASRVFEQGSYVVRLDQPAGILAQVLLLRSQEIDPDFLDAQREREQRRESAEIYDLTGWSMPVLFGVECFETEVFSHRPDLDGLSAPLQVETYEPSPLPEKPATDTTPARVAVVLPGGRNDTYRALIALLRAGAKVDCSGEPLTLSSEEASPREMERGTILVKAKDNEPSMLQYALDLGTELGLDPIALDSSWTETGKSLGSNDVKRIELPKVALAWDRPTDANSAGSARYLLEERYGLPVTEVRTNRLASGDLDEFDVIILPDGSGYGSVFGDRGRERLRSWVRRGGTLIALGGGATAFVADEDTGLLALESEDRPKETADPDAAFDLERAVLPEREPPQRSLGVLLSVRPNPRDVCAFGAPESVAVVSTDRVVYTPIPLDRGTNVAVFAPRDELLLSGFTWPEKLDQLAQKAYLVHDRAGDGHVIVFAEDPNLRAFVDGTNLFFLNSVLLAPGF